MGTGGCNSFRCLFAIVPKTPPSSQAPSPFPSGDGQAGHRAAAAAILPVGRAMTAEVLGAALDAGAIVQGSDLGSRIQAKVGFHATVPRVVVQGTEGHPLFVSHRVPPPEKGRRVGSHRMPELPGAA